eukprot:1536015-Alexandrium_andersonii.AAC.1
MSGLGNGGSGGHKQPRARHGSAAPCAQTCMCVMTHAFVVACARAGMLVSAVTTANCCQWLRQARVSWCVLGVRVCAFCVCVRVCVCACAR